MKVVDKTCLDCGHIWVTPVTGTEEHDPVRMGKNEDCPVCGSGNQMLAPLRDVEDPRVDVSVETSAVNHLRNLFGGMYS